MYRGRKGVEREDVKGRGGGREEEGGGARLNHFFYLWKGKS